jgi:hypothetical protein
MGWSLVQRSLNRDYKNLKNEDATARFELLHLMKKVFPM